MDCQKGPGTAWQPCFAFSPSPFTRLRPDALQSDVARPEFRLCSIAASQQERRRSRWRCAKTTAYPAVQTLIAPTNRLGFPSSSRRCALEPRRQAVTSSGDLARPCSPSSQPLASHGCRALCAAGGPHRGIEAPQGEEGLKGQQQSVGSRSVPLTVGRRGSPPAADGPHAPLSFHTHKHSPG